MDHIGRRLLPADRATVWAHLTSAESLAHCIPGAERVSGTARDGFDMEVTQKVGPFALHFAGRITLSDVVPARAVTLTGQGKGGVAGLAQGAARIALADHPAGCEIAWDLGALVEGRIAKLGARLMSGAVAPLTERFLDRLDSLLRGAGPGAGG